MVRIHPLLLLALAACQPPPDDLPPAWCDAEGELQLGCSGADCVAAVMVDYKRVEPRGYHFRQLTQKNAVTRSEAEQVALDHVTKTLGGKTPRFTDCDDADDFFNCFLNYENSDNWLVTIHAGSGEVVFAGLEIWANPERGYDPPLPAAWNGPAPLGCTDAAAEPADKALRKTGIPMGTPEASTPTDAWEVVKRLNLTEQFTLGKAYRVMVVSYSPATGEFDPWAADWLVWLTLVH